jgi:hypothetical protein
MIPQFLARMLSSKDAVGKAVETIESGLMSLDDEAARREMDGPDEHGWILHLEGHPVFVDLQRVDDAAFLRVYSPVVTLPEEGMLAFYRKLLELNGEMLGCAYAADDATILIDSRRLIDGLDEDEVAVAVYGVAHYSAEALKLLVEEFGARPFFEKDV